MKRLPRIGLIDPRAGVVRVGAGISYVPKNMALRVLRSRAAKVRADPAKDGSGELLRPAIDGEIPDQFDAPAVQQALGQQRQVIAKA